MIQCHQPDTRHAAVAVAVMVQDATVERARQAAADEVEGIRQELQDNLAAAEAEAAAVRQQAPGCGCCHCQATPATPR